MSSDKWTEVRERLLIDERKQRNAEYHAIPRGALSG
jgi:hypothetical protein